MKAALLLAALSLQSPALAPGTTHDIKSTRGVSVDEPGARYSATTADISFWWVEGTTQARSSARLTNSANDVFLFELVAATSTSSSNITGKWNITKNGVRVCTSCDGRVNGFTGSPASFRFQGGPPGNTSGYLFSGYVTSRTDY